VVETIKGKLDLGEGILVYETAGSGDPLVLVHAGFLDSRMFDAQWQTLADRFQLIRYDMLGFGESSPATGPTCRRENLWRLLDHLDVTSAHFLGCSMGGEVVLDLALQHPERARSLTLVGAVPSGFQLKGEPPQHAMEMFEALGSGQIERASELQIRIWLEGARRTPGDVNGELRQRALTMNRIPVERRTFLIADAQPPANPLNTPAVTRLHDVNSPTFVVVGALDHPEVLRAGDLMAATMPNARHSIIEDAGHVPSYERPDAFNHLLLNFLADAQSEES